MPVVFIATKDVYTYKKVLGNIQEVKARNGITIAIITEGDEEIKNRLLVQDLMQALPPHEFVRNHRSVEFGPQDPGWHSLREAVAPGETASVQSHRTVFTVRICVHHPETLPEPPS